jgi:membrane associated rhomboid family serine protease
MIPLKDHNPTRRIPFVNLLLIAANIGVFVYQFFYLPQGPGYLIQSFGVVPFDLLDSPAAGPHALLPAPLTVISAMFIHGGWLHLLGNMLYLWIFGDNVEDRLGHGRYLVFYLACGVIAALVHAVVFAQSKVPCVGASGAISGVLMAYLIFFPKARVSTLFVIFIFIRIVRLPAVVLLGLWIGLQIIGGMQSLTAEAGGVAWFAHIGGIAAGIFLSLLLRPPRPRRRVAN